MTVRTNITTAPLTVDDHETAVADPTVGAVVTFRGIVRDHDGGREVSHLVYEAHPSAGEVLAGIAAEFEADEAITAVAVSHRVGDLRVGDVALIASVAAAHRAKAFAGCARLVDAVKARLPVWKHQFFADGTDEWVNCP